MVELFIAHKANLNVYNKNKISPILLAEKNHFNEIFNLLYAAGSEFVWKNKW